MILREKMLKKRYLYLLEEKCFMLRIVGQSALFVKRPLYLALSFFQILSIHPSFLYILLD